MVPTASYFALDAGGNPFLFYLTGTITASIKSMSGTYNCGMDICIGQSGTLSGTMK
jgi:hypothetical protein